MLSEGAAEHFRLHLFAAVARVIGEAARGFESVDALLEQLPFLAGYRDELPEGSIEDPAWWPAAIADFERGAGEHLPLRALREAAGLDHDALTLLLSLGLQEEDPRFGLLFDAAQGTSGQQRPTLGLVNAWWRGEVDRGEVRARLRRLHELGLVGVLNPDAPRTQWQLHVHAPVWDALRGEASDGVAAWLTHRPREALVPLGGLIAPEALRRELARLPELLASGEVRALLVRGPRHCGRRTLLGAVAHAVGRGVLEARGLARDDDHRWRTLGSLATLLNAVPVAVFDAGPGETIDVPSLAERGELLGVVMGRQGGARGPGVEGALTLTLGMPAAGERRAHWRAALGDTPCPALDDLASRFRMTSGHIRRAAPVARSLARLDGRREVALDDVRRAAQTLHRQALDTLAARVTCEGAWTSLALPPETLRDLRDLEARCRQRETIRERVGPVLRSGLNPGVRAMFQGPSGTGKTFAARVLAAELGMELYRVDLASVVNKYIGETEKSLNQVFTLAEELDVILLLDEGDALLAQRTGVQSSNDRYANLETNFLLQRLEAYEGIVVVTTNAGSHIDTAFQRRMDVVVDFRAPDASERHALWQLHLPPEHAVDGALLAEVASRCQLTGGQIRNAVLHAALLAAEVNALVSNPQIEAAVVREYRKSGGQCPLRHLSDFARQGGR
ncbi:ATP-binding protein [Sorangium sp. So ce448]|uniref:ATP-binding protein n=1 Tax=Sorangium sp. So ce448 TaxID=3133314 RepID=UPI003F5D6D83